MRHWLRSTMNEHGVNQLDLAVSSGLSPSTVFRLMHESNPHLVTIALAAEGMGYQLKLEFCPREGSQ